MNDEQAAERRSYRKVYRRLWTNPKFLSLIDGERVLTLYLLTGPQTNRIGLFKVSLPMAAEDLSRPLQTVRRQFAKVLETFAWQWDANAKVLWIPSWWKHNPPPKQGTNFKGLLADRNDLPTTALRTRFDAHRAYVPAALHGAFAVLAVSSEPSTAPSTAPPVNGAQHEPDPTALSTKQEALSTKHQAESRDAPAALSARAPEHAEPNQPVEMDRWWHEFWSERYPGQGRTPNALASHAFYGLLCADVRKPARVLYDELCQRLEGHKRSAQWRKGKIPRLDRYLTEGLHLQELPEFEPSDLVNERSTRVLTSGAMFAAGGKVE